MPKLSASLPLTGMLSLDAKTLSPTKQQASISKNYLNEEEIKLLGVLVEQYLESVLHGSTVYHLRVVQVIDVHKEFTKTKYT